tara:strand:+ start:273 stop:1049 length:777 start_codon:yes stop_codon:yes gene_type:complete
MIIGTAQMKMGWTTEENIATIVSSIEHARSMKADLLVFPELALTGFHRKIKDEVKKVSNDPGYEQWVQDACANNQQAICLGLPTFFGDKIFNSYRFISADGEIVSTTHKLGLTGGERMLFTDADHRPMVSIGDRALAAVMCREVGDLELLKGKLQTADVLIWPGFVSNLTTDDPDVEDGTTEQASAFALACKAKLVQCNWAHSLNKPELVELGGSSFIDDNGEVIWSCPWNEPGIGYFDLDSNAHDWQPLGSIRGQFT